MRKCWPYSVVWHSAVIDPPYRTRPRVERGGGQMRVAEDDGHRRHPVDVVQAFVADLRDRARVLAGE